jgi:hypothetical protein
MFEVVAQWNKILNVSEQPLVNVSHELIMDHSSNSVQSFGYATVVVYVIVHLYAYSYHILFMNNASIVTLPQWVHHSFCVV